MCVVKGSRVCGWLCAVARLGRRSRCPDEPNQTVQRPLPDIGTAPFPTRITGAAPNADQARPGTKEFRYWAAADALGESRISGRSLRRAMLARNGGRDALGKVDEGEELNASYDREALNFFQGFAGGPLLTSRPDAVEGPCLELLQRTPHCRRHVLALVLRTVLSRGCQGSGHARAPCPSVPSRIPCAATRSVLPVLPPRRRGWRNDA